MKLLVLTLVMACEGGAAAPPPVMPSAPQPAPAPPEAHVDAGVQIGARVECWNGSGAFGRVLRDSDGSERETLPPDAVVVLPPDLGRQSPGYEAQIRLGAALAKSGCDRGTPAPAATTPPPEPRPSSIVASPFVSGQGHQYAIVQVRGFVSEPCTNMGGMNWTFSVEGMPAEYKLRGGGHGIFGAGSTLPGIADQTADEGSWKDRYYVAEVSLATHGRFEWHIECVPGHPMFDGTVLAVAPARDLEAARALLAAAATRGLPGAVRIDRFGR